MSLSVFHTLHPLFMITINDIYQYHQHLIIPINAFIHRWRCYCCCHNDLDLNRKKPSWRERFSIFCLIDDWHGRVSGLTVLSWSFHCRLECHIIMCHGLVTLHCTMHVVTQTELLKRWTRNSDTFVCYTRSTIFDRWQKTLQASDRIWWRERAKDVL